jgi:hypothetical protein
VEGVKGRRCLVLQALLFVGLGAGCTGGGTSSWDGAPKTWDPAPPRMVVGPDGGLHATDMGPVGGQGGGSSYTTICTRMDQPNCCYDGKELIGNPQCGWRRLSRGETAAITAAYKDSAKVTLPAALQLAAEAPASFATFDECVHKPLGFVLSGAALVEETLVGNISHYSVRANGTWQGHGGGGTSQLVAARDTTITSREGSQPAPTYELGEGLCAPLRDGEAVALIQFFDQIDFTVGGVDYSANFRTHPNGSEVTGYYVLTEKGF